MNFKLVLAVAVLFMPTIGLADEWIPISPAGVHIDRLATSVAQPGRLYAAGAGGVFRSDDSGETWVAIDGPLPDAAASAVAASVTNADVVAVALVGDAIWVSTDGGTSWTMGTGAEVERVVDLAIDPLDDAHMIALDGDSLVRTIDRGAEWTRVGFESELTAVGFTPSRPAIYIGSVAGLFVSVDDGELWNPVDQWLWFAELPVIAMTAPHDAYSIVGLVEGADGAAAFREPDGWGGRLESHADPDSIEAIEHAERLAFASTDSNGRSTGVLGGPGGLFASVDAGDEASLRSRHYGYGNHWFPVMAGLPAPAGARGYDVSAVAIDPAIPRRYYAVVNGVLYARDGALATDLRVGGRTEDTQRTPGRMFTVCCYEDDDQGPRLELLFNFFNYAVEGASDVEFTVRLDPRTELDSYWLDDMGSCTHEDLTIVCKFAEVPPGFGNSGHVSVLIHESGDLYFEAEIASAERDATPDNNIATATRTVTFDVAEDEPPPAEAQAEESPPEDSPPEESPPEGAPANNTTPSTPSSTSSASGGGGGVMSLCSVLFVGLLKILLPRRRRQFVK